MALEITVFTAKTDETGPVSSYKSKFTLIDEQIRVLLSGSVFSDDNLSTFSWLSVRVDLAGLAGSSDVGAGSAG